MNFTIAVEPRCRNCTHVRYTHIEDGACTAGHVISTPGSAVADQGSCRCRRFVSPEESGDEDR